MRLDHRSFIFFFAGVFTTLALVLLTGAGYVNPIGKYQLEAVTRDRVTQVYVLDTTTGVVKWVDAYNTPFEALKGE